MNQTENAILAKLAVLHAKMLRHAKNVTPLLSYMITLALLNVLLGTLQKMEFALNATQPAKLALQMIQLNVLPALLHTNYGKEAAPLNVLQELTQQVLELVLPAVLQSALDAQVVLPALNA
jgi:hypothetical protein